MIFHPSGDTLGFLAEVESALRERNHAPYLLSLYGYYCAHNGEEKANREVAQATHIGEKPLARNNAVLKLLEVVTFDKGFRNKKIINVQDYYGEPLSNLNLDLLIHSLSSTSIYTTSKEERLGEVKVRVKDSEFRVEDIIEDEDWKRAEAVLSKYFKPHQIAPLQLTRKNYFSLLCDLLDDSAIDFDKYCEWYRINKYPQKKFHFGLFLLPGMVAEYKDTLEDLDDPYLHTNRMHESDSFKESLERKKSMLKKMGITEDVDEG